METSEKASFVERAFRQLQADKKVKTQGDFARLLGVSQNTISAAKNGSAPPFILSKSYGIGRGIRSVFSDKM